MKIAIAKESSPGEDRVILRPEEAAALVQAGHSVLVETRAGAGVQLPDEAYARIGALVVQDKAELYGTADLVVKLKFPTAQEFALLDGNILVSMLHHAQNPDHIYALGMRGAVAVELESIRTPAGERLVDATDMTGEAGVLYATRHLRKVPAETHAVVLGYGRVGSAAIRTCHMLGMPTKILRRSEFAHLPHFLEGRDLLINALAWPDEMRRAGTPLVSREMLRGMDPSAVVLDLAVDFPGPIETSRPTSIQDPWYTEEGRVHIGIYGYPGLVPLSSTRRYSLQVLPILRLIADNQGLDGIGALGELGRSVHDSIVDPDRWNWQALAPEDVPDLLAPIRNG